MGETRQGDREQAAQTRDSIRGPQGKAPHRVHQIDAFPKTMPKTLAGVATLFRRFIGQIRDAYVVGIKGGEGYLGRWDSARQLIQSSLREFGGKLHIGVPVDIAGDLYLEQGSLLLDNGESIKWDDTLDPQTFLGGIIGLDANNNLVVGTQPVATGGAVLFFTNGLQRGFITSVGSLVWDEPVQIRGIDTYLQLPNMSDLQMEAVPSPARGMMLYNNDHFAYEAYYETAGPGTGVWLPFAEFPHIANGTNATPTVTPIPAINTVVACQTVWTASGNEIFFDLDVTGLIWTYTGPNRSGTSSIQFEGSAEKVNGGIPENFRFVIQHNGFNVGIGIQVATRQNEPAYWKTSAIRNLQNGDTIQLFVQNLSNNDDVSVLEAFCLMG